MKFPPAWEDMYAKALQYKAQNGNSINGISKSNDAILAAWIARQDEIVCRHLQGKGTRLTDDQAIKLLALGVNGGRGAAAAGGGGGGGALLLGGVGSGGSGKVLAMGKSEASLDFEQRWNAMFSKLKEFKVCVKYCCEVYSLACHVLLNENSHYFCSCSII